MSPPKQRRCRQVGKDINRLLAETKTDKNTRITVRGAAVSMNESFRDFGLGLLISIALVYLILMAQFTSFIDPFIILMAIPPGLAGVVMILLFTGSTLNIMSLMGVIMMTGIVVSNSILIVEFSGILHAEGLAAAGSNGAGMQGSFAADPHDLAGHVAGHDPDGAGTGSGQRTIRPAGPGDYRRTGSFGGGDGVSGSGGLSGDPYAARAQATCTGRRPRHESRQRFYNRIVAVRCGSALAQSPTTVAELPSAPAPNINLSAAGTCFGGSRCWTADDPDAQAGGSKPRSRTIRA